MESIFRVPFDALAIEDLRAFLDEAGDEGITWEVKGPRPDQPEKPLDSGHVIEAGCALANAIGGYIIVGALRDKETDEWSLPGSTINHSEPGTWLDDAIGALRPRPRIGDPKVWKLDEGRVAAVVEVHPVAVPPCMTPGGVIFERTSGKSVKVTDPLVLARLSDSGRAARQRAEDGTAGALVALNALMPHKSVNVYLALRAAAYEPDISRRLFADATPAEPAMVHRIDDLIAAGLRPSRYDTGPSGISRSVRQDGHIHRTGSGSLANDPDGGDHLWLVRSAWDGSVGIRCAGNETSIGIDDLLAEIIVPAWRVASEIVPLLGGYGPSHLAILIRDGFKLFAVDGGGPYDWPSTTVARWLDDLAPTDEMVASIRRELLRAAGSSTWEPQPDADESIGRRGVEAS